MDWRSIRFDWNRARAFLVTAEEGSLSAAARALGMTQPTLGRQISALEQELSVSLFERAGRGLALTPTGVELLGFVRTMGDAANQMSLSATGQSELLEGNVCITATEVAAAFELPPIIRKLRKQEPGIKIELIASNSTSDLKRREADIAIRAFRPTQPDLIAKRLKGVRARLYATPSYLDSIGNPNSPEEFTHAEFIGFDRSERLIEGLREMGFHLDQSHFPVITENHLVHWELVRHGIGIGIMPEEYGDHDPKVVRILPRAKPFPVEVWLVAHRELRTSRRIRRVYDFLAAELS